MLEGTPLRIQKPIEAMEQQMKNTKQLVLLTMMLGLLGTFGAVHAAEADAEAIQAALAHADRPAADVADDAVRMPLQTLTFAGLKSGMRVVDLEAAGGYYTEIISRAVGSGGEVIMQNVPAFDSFLGDSVEQRLAAGRLPNVRASKTNFDALDVADGTVDMVAWIMGPHELWFAPQPNVSLGDPAKTFAEIARVLKSGGVFLAIDHIASDSSGPEVGGTLHRIRHQIVTDLWFLVFDQTGREHRNTTLSLVDPNLWTT